MEIRAIRTKVFIENEDLVPFILKYVKKIKEGSVVVVTSKIVALSEGRTVPCVNEKDKEKFIKKESEFALKTRHVYFTVKDGAVMADAGIDGSNAGSRLVLLPKDSYGSATKIRSALLKKFRLKNLGVIISDSGLLPLRDGVIGMARGYAGFRGIKSYVSKKDIFGRRFKYSKTNIADSLATAATVCMGEGNERRPLSIITEAPIVFADEVDKKELRINPKEDIFYPVIKNIFHVKSQK